MQGRESDAVRYVMHYQIRFCIVVMFHVQCFEPHTCIVIEGFSKLETHFVTMTSYDIISDHYLHDEGECEKVSLKNCNMLIMTWYIVSVHYYSLPIMMKESEKHSASRTVLCSL